MQARVRVLVVWHEDANRQVCLAKIMILTLHVQYSLDHICYLRLVESNWIRVP